MVFQERTYSVLVVSASAAFDRTVSDLLPRNDFFPVNMVKSCGEARRALLDKEYDIVLINAPLQDDFGMRLAIDVCSTSHAGVLLCVKSALYNDVYSKVTPHGVLTLSKPTSLPMITHSLRVLCALRERLRQELGREPSLSELSAQTGWTPEEIAQVDLATEAPDSLQRETADGLALEGLLGTEAPEEGLVERIALREAVDQLPEKERMTILLRYFKGLTQERAARVLGVSQVQVSRLERRGLERLRQSFAE